MGVFRLLEALDKHDIRPTAAVDAGLVMSRRSLVEALMSRNAEFVGHGVALSRMLNEQMSESSERAEIEASRDALQAITGRRPLGWLGAEYGESTRTVRLLHELGFRYVCDWPNDEQPYMLHADSGDLVALPVTVDLDDVMAQRVRRLTPRTWSAMVLDAFTRLCRDGRHSGRLLMLNLHAHVSGQPFCYRHVDYVLGKLREGNGAWFATAGEIANHYLQSPNHDHG